MNRMLVKFELEPNIFVEVYPEEQPDWSWAEDDEELMRKVRRGDVEQVFVLVKALDSTGNVEGEDSLGGVVIGLDDHKQEIRDAIDAHDMVKIATDDLTRKLAEIKAVNE